MAWAGKLWFEVAKVTLTVAELGLHVAIYQAR